jgi:hypothetical protein
MRGRAVRVGGPEAGACRPTAPDEELGFGVPQRRRGRLVVQVLRGDHTPVWDGGILTPR